MIRATLFIAILPVVAIACGNNTDSKSESSETATTTADGAAPTWADDIEPFMAEHCVRCHQEGGLGPADFTDASVVESLAPAILGAMQDGRMPPPAADPNCRDYVGSDILTIQPEDITRFEAWVNAGMPPGEGATTTPPPVDPQLKDPDAIITLPAPYVPTFQDTANPGNEYRCFAVDPGDMAGKYITAMAPVIDQASLVHHVVLFTVEKTALDPMYVRDDGWDCIDGQGANALSGMIAAWAPGMLPIEFPGNHGMKVPEDSWIVMQMHYFYSGTDTVGLADQSGYAFHIEEGPVPQVYMAPIENHRFVIPAGDPAYSATESFVNEYLPLYVLGVFPHMHTLGTGFHARTVAGDGSETCLVEGTYDFNNQMTYQFTEPALFDMGDELQFTCQWNNENGDASVRYGERTDEEMCFFFAYVTPTL